MTTEKRTPNTDRYRPIYREIAVPGSKAWMQARITGIGSSEAAAACGVSKWETPLDVFNRKTRRTPEFSGNIHTRVGSALEPLILREFEEETGRKIQAPAPMIRSAKWPWMIATPDGLDGTDALVEAKNTGFGQAWGDPGTDEIPEEHLIQSQHQMAVSGRSLVWVPVLIDSRDFRIYRVDRAEELIKWIVETERALWGRIMEESAPEIDFDHATAIEAINSLFRFRVGEKTARQLSKRAMSAKRRLDGLKETEKDLKRESEACRALILSEIGDAEFGIFPDGSAMKRKKIAGSEYTVKRSESIRLTDSALPKTIILKNSL